MTQGEYKAIVDRIRRYDSLRGEIEYIDVILGGLDSENEHTFDGSLNKAIREIGDKDKENIANMLKAALNERKAALESEFERL